MFLRIIQAVFPRLKVPFTPGRDDLQFWRMRLKRMFENNGIAAFTSPAPNSPIEASSSQRFFYSMREVLLFSVYRIV